MHIPCMATTTISISELAYSRLKQLKEPGDSFSDVLLRELPQPYKTAGEILDHFVTHGVPPSDPEGVEAMKQGRGRRSGGA